MGRIFSKMGGSILGLIYVLNGSYRGIAAGEDIPGKQGLKHEYLKHAKIHKKCG